MSVEVLCRILGNECVKSDHYHISLFLLALSPEESRKVAANRTDQHRPSRQLQPLRIPQYL